MTKRAKAGFSKAGLEARKKLDMTKAHEPMRYVPLKGAHDAIAVRFGVCIRGVKYGRYFDARAGREVDALFVEWEAPDPRDGRPSMTGTYIPLPQRGRREDLPRLLRIGLRDLLLHELDEAIVVNGKTPFNPHCEDEPAQAGPPIVGTTIPVVFVDGAVTPEGAWRLHYDDHRTPLSEGPTLSAALRAAADRLDGVKSAAPSPVRVEVVHREMVTRADVPAEERARRWEHRSDAGKLDAAGNWIPNASPT